MCTNRLKSLDPAVKRRAADILIFERPNDTQRHAVLGEPRGSLVYRKRRLTPSWRRPTPARNVDTAIPFPI
jgi:hypothetical protein